MADALPNLSRQRGGHRVGHGIGHTYTTVAQGDLAVDGEPGALAARRRAVVDLPWTWVRQVHGAGVVTVTAPGEHAGASADAIVTAAPGAAVAVQTADCGSILLAGDGAVGVVHAGWRGLEAGVIAAAAVAMAELGAPPTAAVLGPVIRPRCYEFDDPARSRLAERFGPAVAATTGWGTPALDLAAGITAACAELGLTLDDGGTCTACSPVHWSYRARGDAARQALVAWIEP